MVKRKNRLTTDACREVRSTFSRFLSILILSALAVAFLAGLRTTAPDMEYTADNYYDRNHMMDGYVLSTLGVTDSDLEALAAAAGVAGVEGGKSLDATARDAIVVVRDVPERLNLLEVEEGRLPQAADECVTESLLLVELGLELGDTLELTLEEGGEDELVRTEYTIVGKVNSPLYVSNDRGSSSLGTGSVDAFVYIPAENFTMDYYTVAYLTFEGLEELDSYGGEYDARLDDFINSLEALADERAQLRYEALIGDAQMELDDARAELDDAKAEADRELDDAWQELQDARQELDDGWQEYNDGLQELEDSIAGAKQEIADGQRELDDALAGLNDGELELQDARQELDDGWQKYYDGLAEYQNGLAEYEDGERQYDEGLAEYEDGKRQYEDGLAEYEDGKRQYESGLTEYENGAAKVSAGWTEYYSGTAELESTIKATAQEQTELAITGMANQAVEENDASLQAAAAQAAKAALQEQGIQEGSLIYDMAYAQAYGQAYEAAKTEAYNQAYNECVKSYDMVYQQVYAQVLNSDEVTAADAQLSSAASQLREAEQELNDSKAELDAAEAELASAKAELDDAKAELDNAAAELDAAKAELEDAWDQLDAARVELEDALTELEDGEAEYAEGRAELDDGWREYNDGLAELADARDTLDRETADARRELADALTELEDGEKKYADGLKEYEDGKAEAEEKLADAERKLADAQAEVDDVEECEWYVLGRDTNVGFVNYSMDAERVGNLANIFPVIFFLVAALACLTTMTRMVEEQRTQIGALKALGFSRFDISKKYLGYAFWASLIGGLLGLVIGCTLIPAVIANAFNILYNIPKLEFKIQPLVCVLAVLAAVACTTGAALWACISTLTDTPANLMRPKAPKAGKRVLLERVKPIWNCLSFTWKVTIRNLFRYQRRFWMTVIGIGGCTALIVTGFGLHESIFDVLDKQFDEISLYDATVGLDDKVTQEQLDAVTAYLDRTGAVARYLPVFQDSIDVSKNGPAENCTVFAVDDFEAFCQFFDLRHRKDNEPVTLTDDGVVISEKLSEILGVQVGDTVTLEGGKRVQAQVTDIVENYVYHKVFMTDTLYQRLFGGSTDPNVLMLTYEDGIGQGESDEVSAALMAMDAVSSYSYIAVIRDSFTNSMNAINYAVIIIILAAAALAFVVLYNLTNINITERTRELATLKVLGFYDMETTAYVYRENIFLTIFGVLLGLVLGRFLHAWMVLTVEINIVMFGRTAPPYAYILAAVLTALFSVVVNIAAHFKLKKVDMVESLKTVE